MINQYQEDIIDEFIDGLDKISRDITTAWVHIPNTPSCILRVMELDRLYGNRVVEKVTDKLEAMRQRIGVHYCDLQPKLQARLPNVQNN